jgi:hypothetical protein
MDFRKVTPDTTNYNILTYFVACIIIGTLILLILCLEEQLATEHVAVPRGMYTYTTIYLYKRGN